jgi:HEPN domain-containing protein
MREACSATRSTRALCCMANPKRVHALLEMADEDLAGARELVNKSTRLARYHVQQSAEKAVKALLERRQFNPGREHRFEYLAEMLPLNDSWRSRIQSLDSFSAAATSHRYPTPEGRVIPPPDRDMVEREIAEVAALIRDVRIAVGESSD